MDLVHRDTAYGAWSHSVCGSWFSVLAGTNRAVVANPCICILFDNDYCINLRPDSDVLT